LASAKTLSSDEREAVFAALCSEDAVAVSEASRLLSEDRAPTTSARLLSLLDTQSRAEVRRGILYALAWHGGLIAWDVAVRILSDSREDPDVRGQAAEILEYNFSELSPGEVRFAATAALLVALKDPETEVRHCAVHALGATGHLPLLPALHAMLSDRTPIKGLGQTIGDIAAERMEWLQELHQSRLEDPSLYER
jgi:HEAT repeat protein